MGFESILKTYEKGRYTKITVNCDLEGFEGFTLSPESVVAINKIQMAHHCPEIKIDILGAGEKDGATTLKEEEFPKIVITGDKIPKYNARSRRYDNPFYVGILSSHHPGYFEIVYTQLSIISDVKIAVRAFEEMVRCLVSDFINTGLIDSAHADEARIALGRKIEYIPGGKLPDVK